VSERADPGSTRGDDADTVTDPFTRLRAAVDASDWPAATAAVRSDWFTLAAADSEITRALLERVPAAALRSEPLLAMELGIAYNKLRFHRLRALRYFATAVRAARSAKDSGLSPVDRLLIRSSETGAYRLLGRTAASVSAARAALELADGLSDEDRAAVSDLPRVYAVIGVSLYYGGLAEEALEAAARGLAEAPTTPPSNGMGALALLAGIHAVRGDLPQVREHIEYARSGPWTDQQRDGYSGVFYRLAEALVAVERFDTETARGQLSRLLAMTTGRHANEHWTTIAAVQATIELVDGNPGQALAGLDEFAALRGAEGRGPRVRADLARIRSLLQLALGNPDAAAAIVKRDLPSGPVAGIERARVALALGQTGSALNELRPLAGMPLSTREAAEATAIETAVLLRISPTPRREGIVYRLGTLLEHNDLRLAVALLPPHDMARVAEALRSAGFARVVAELPSRPLLRDVEVELLLSQRELAVLEQLMRTGSIAEIAAALVVSSNTVKTHIRAVYRKLGVSGREDAIAVALERHLLVERD